MCTTNYFKKSNEQLHDIIEWLQMYSCSTLWLQMYRCMYDMAAGVQLYIMTAGVSWCSLNVCKRVDEVVILDWPCRLMLSLKQVFLETYGPSIGRILVKVVFQSVFFIARKIVLAYILIVIYARGYVIIWYWYTTLI